MPKKRISLFLLDKHTLMLEALTAMLNDSHQLEVISTYSCGLNSMKDYTSLKPDIILTSDNLVDIDIVTFCYEYKFNYPECKIIMYSDISSSFQVLECIKIGVSGIVCSSNPISVLIKAIIKVRSGGLYYCDQVSQIIANGYREQNSPRRSLQTTNILTAREHEIFSILLEGKPNSEISSLLHISVKTVSAHKSNIFKKLNIHSMIELYRYGEKLVHDVRVSSN